MLVATRTSKTQSRRERRPNQIGDLLVTSDVAGVAKKSEPLNLGACRFTAPARSSAKLSNRSPKTGEIMGC